mmetsp:Transcript_74342/g.210387  ORF Transcript_74342/g.210387 Transcript_74342/m.210387 type:complete len:242 (+) Transcript_74342:498-1223(+)
MQLGGAQGWLNLSYANRLRWREAGGVEHTAQTIRSHFDNGEVVLQCWYAFSSGTRSPNERAFVDAGGIRLAMHSMTDHANYKNVREEVMKALRAIGLANADWRKKLVEAGFLHKLIRAMREVPLDLHTQWAACANLAILTADSLAYRAVAAREGAAELALAAMRRFPKMISSADGPPDDQYTVYEDCLEALTNLARDPDARRRLAQFDGLEQEVWAAMQSRLESPRAQAAGQRALAAARAG